MRRCLRVLSYFSMMILAVELSGCEGMRATIPSKPPQSEYLEVDYRRFVSGVYVDELADKYVKINCTYSSTMAGTLPGGYSSARHMSFLALSPTGISLEETAHLIVVVPKDVADVVFTLKHGDRITAYGRAVPVTTRTAAGKIFKDLILEADLIQTQKPEGPGTQRTTTPPLSEPPVTQPPSPVLPLSPTRDVISSVQVQLKARGFDPGPPDGSIGPKTREALRRLQNARRLQVTGELDTPTLEALGIQFGQPGMQIASPGNQPTTGHQAAARAPSSKGTISEEQRQAFAKSLKGAKVLQTLLVGKTHEGGGASSTFDRIRILDVGLALDISAWNKSSQPRTFKLDKAWEQNAFDKVYLADSLGRTYPLLWVDHPEDVLVNAGQSVPITYYFVHPGEGSTHIVLHGRLFTWEPVPCQCRP